MPVTQTIRQSDSTDDRNATVKRPLPTATGLDLELARLCPCPRLHCELREAAVASADGLSAVLRSSTPWPLSSQEPWP
eukprot:5233453-Pleurochrysis_carterae.AAC.1